MSKSQLSVDLSLNAKGYNSALNEAKRNTEQYETDLTDLSSKFVNVRGELSQTRKLILTLENAWRNMSDAEKQSMQGQVLARNLQEAKQKGADLVDTIGDIQQELRNMASDTANLDAFKQGFEVLGNMASAAANAYASLTGDTEDAKRALTTFAAVQSTVNTLTALGNALQQQSALMLGIKRIQQLALNAATEAGTTATYGASAAQATFNAVANANPYMLLITGIGLLVGAYISFQDEINSLIGIETEEESKQKELTEAYNQQAKQLGDTEAKVKRLQIEWKNLKTDSEKNQWISDNKDKFKDLGIEINNIADAENLLVRNSETFIRAQQMKAEAMAYSAIAASNYQKALEKEREATEADVSTLEIAFTQLQQWAKGGYVMTEKQILHHKRKGMFDEALALREEADEAIKQAAQLDADAAKLLADNGFKETSNTTTGKSGKTGSTTSSKTQKNALEQLEERKKELEHARESLIDEFGNVTNKQVFDKLTKSIGDIDTVLKKAEAVLKPEVETDKVDSNKLQQEIDKIFSTLDDAGEEKMKASFSGLSDVAKEEADNVYKEYEKVYTAREKLMQLINNPELSTEQYDMVSAAIEAIAHQFEAATEAVRAFNEESAQANEANEKQAAYADYINDQSEAWVSYTELLKSVTGMTKLLGDTQAAQMLQFTANTATILADTIKTITAMNAKAIAEGAASAFALPFPANLAAWATVFATITSIFSSLPKFADGGIVNSPSKIGDMTIARVNGGEMILAERQQRNLWDAIDNNKLGGGNNEVVIIGETKVRGEDIDIVYSNYKRKKNTSR